VAPRKIDDPQYKGIIYPIEVIACYPYPKGQKAHETVVTIDVKPSEVHKALEGLGLKAGSPARGEEKLQAEGPDVVIALEVPGETEGEVKRVPIEKLLVDIKTGKPMPKVKWKFTGSALIKPDPNKDETMYGADKSGTLIAVFPVTDETVFQTNLTIKEEKFVKLETDKKILPKEGTPVKLIIEVPGETEGEVKRVPVEKLLVDIKTGKPMPKVKWKFTGSTMIKPDPNKEETTYGADKSGTLIAVFPVTDETVFQTNLTIKEEKFVKLETDKKMLPKEGTPVKLIIEVP